MSRDELLLSPRAGFGLLGSAAVFDQLWSERSLRPGIARAAYGGALRLLREGMHHGRRRPSRTAPGVASSGCSRSSRPRGP